MSEPSALSLLPPVVAIAVALWRKNALLALFVGLWLCFFMLAQYQFTIGSWHTITGIAQVFSSTSNLYIVLFSLLIGALVNLLNHTGAVNGFINKLSQWNLVKNQRQAALLPTIIGTSIFTDSNLSMFSGGLASQQLFDKYKLSRARLAYLLDSTCSPVSILILINGWGAYVLGLLDGYHLERPVEVLINTIYLNFYAIIALVLAYFTAFSGKVFGPMKQASSIASTEVHSENIAPARIMLVPMTLLIGLTFILLYISGDGDIRHGSGAFSVFWAIFSAFIVLITLIKQQQLLSWSQIFLHSLHGIRHMLPVVMILVLSFAFGDAIKALGAGSYVSQLVSNDAPLWLIAPSLFIFGALMSFATGTSWGTFAILVPIAMPIALSTNLPPEFLLAAVLSGGIFGDHASPISDSTIVASIASGCDHFEHVKTQLPYALFAAIVSLVLFSLVGLHYS